jgi:hypothetical protein
MTEREMLLSEAVDCLTAALELADDQRLRWARELVLTVALGRRAWWRFWRR